ncbi:MAG: hypothetical protein JNM63_06585 [Spirochaetia bacterium]|nr:hypothetical protein [Spirochaetia bacterium]
MLLKPQTKYRIQGALKKTPDSGARDSDCVIRVVNYTRDDKLEIFSTLGQDQPRDGSWHTVEGSFVTSANLTERLGIVVYNSNSKESAWFDEIQIIELAQK